MPSMTRKLAVLYGNSPLKEPHNRHIEVIKDIGQSEFIKFKSAMSVLKQFESDRRLLLICIRNLDEFVNFANNFYEQWREKELPGDFRLESIEVELNRLLLNLLSSIRTYLDHTGALLKHRFGVDSGELNEFNTVCSKHYDNCFEYRFMSALRNHSQHKEIPVQNVRLISKLDELSGVTIYDMRISFSRDTLLKDTKIKQTLRNEIALLDEEIDLRPFIVKTMECIYDIDKHVVIHNSEAREAAQSILSIIEPLRNMHGYPIVLEYEVQDDKDISNSPSIYSIPIGVAIDALNIPD